MFPLRHQEFPTNIFRMHRTPAQEEWRRADVYPLAIVWARLWAGSLACLLVLAVIAVVDPATSQEFPADASRGKIVYHRHCLSCHGPLGAGDGPDAAALKVPPANFHEFKSYVKSDEELLRTIEQGVVFSPMHSWQAQLTEAERQDVLAYIRVLVQRGR